MNTDRYVNTVHEIAFIQNMLGIIAIDTAEEK